MCIFNFCLICKVNSCHLFQLSFFICRPPGIRTLRNLDCLAIRIAPASRRRNSAAAIHREPQNSLFIVNLKQIADASAKRLNF